MADQSLKPSRAKLRVLRRLRTEHTPGREGWPASTFSTEALTACLRRGWVHFVPVPEWRVAITPEGERVLEEAQKDA